MVENAENKIQESKESVKQCTHYKARSTQIEVCDNHKFFFTTRLIESRDQAKTCNYRNMALSCTASDLNKNLYVVPTEMLDSMDNPIEFLSQIGNTMHRHQSMKPPEKRKFLKAMEEEVMTRKRRKTLEGDLNL